jgi:hypothetical protein
MKHATLILLCTFGAVPAVSYVEQETWSGGPTEESTEGDWDVCFYDSSSLNWWDSYQSLRLLPLKNIIDPTSRNLSRLVFGDSWSSPVDKIR